MVVLSIAVIAAGLVGFLATQLVRLNAARLRLVQVPNTRSSHITPTPTGGGIGIIAGVLTGFGVFAFMSGVISGTLWGALGLAVSLGFVGFVDDIKPLGVKLRLLAQFIGVATLFWLCGFVPRLDGFGLVSGGVLFCLALVAAVWWLNLYNFMDGIDGFAALQGVLMFSSATLICVLQGGAMVDGPLVALMIGACAALIGFLGLNWYPARIFMGDVGSLFLGFSLLTSAVFTITAGYMSLGQWLILGAIFITDATFTLARRLINGKPPTEAHRAHIYQILAQRFGRHDIVVVILMAINLALLLPLALNI